jgi:hypothetical protein
VVGLKDDHWQGVGELQVVGGLRACCLIVPQL